jgi:hypothetical protein
MPYETGIVGASVVNGRIYVMGGSANYEYNPESRFMDKQDSHAYSKMAFQNGGL